MARTIWNFRREGGWESGPHLPLTLLPRLSHIGHLGPFCPQATLAAFHPPPAHLPLAPSPGMPTILSPNRQCFLLPITASPAIIRILCSLSLSSVFPLVCQSMCLSSLSLSLSLHGLLTQEHQVSRKEARCRNLDRLMYSVLTKASARKVV